jgi:hypothetical protein
MRIVPLLAALSALLLLATPVAADHERDGNRRGDWHKEGRGQWVNNSDQDNGDRDNDDRDNDDRDNDDHDWNRNQARSQDCWGDWNSENRGQWVSIRNGGGNWVWVNNQNWNSDCNRGRHGRFQNRGDGLSDEAADALSDAFEDCITTENLREMRWTQLWSLVHWAGLTPRDRQRIHDLSDLADTLQDHLNDNNLEDLKLKQILQVAHACGLNNRDVVEIILQA